MRTLVELPSGLVCSTDLRQGTDIGIPLDFEGEQPNAFGASRANAHSFSIPGGVLDTTQGGSCNVKTVTLTPHCNGTHTESIRHLTSEGSNVYEVVPKGLIAATLVTVSPERGSTTLDDYAPAKRPDDLLITRRSLLALEKADDSSFLDGVIIRTLPNNRDKLSRDYSRVRSPYLSIQAIEYLIQRGASHLVVDMASIDRTDDDGMMRAHHLWFEVDDRPAVDSARSGGLRTVTEMVYIDDAVVDGPYLLSLQIAPFISDAAPSRPILFPVNLST